MAKTETSYSKLTDEQKAERIERAKLCRAAEEKAIERGFKGEPGRGYWKAVRAYCEANGIKYPVAKRKPAAPKAKAKKTAKTRKVRR